MKVRYNIWRVDVPMNYPGIIADVVALSLDQVFQAVPAHARVQYGFYFVFFLAFYKHCGGGGLARRPALGSGVARVSLTMGKTGCSRERLGGSFRRYAPWPTRASIG